MMLEWWEPRDAGAHAGARGAFAARGMAVGRARDAGLRRRRGVLASPRAQAP